MDLCFTIKIHKTTTEKGFSPYNNTIVVECVINSRCNTAYIPKIKALTTKTNLRGMEYCQTQNSANRVMENTKIQTFLDILAVQQCGRMENDN